MKSQKQQDARIGSTGRLPLLTNQIFPRILKASQPWHFIVVASSTRVFGLFLLFLVVFVGAGWASLAEPKPLCVTVSEMCTTQVGELPLEHTSLGILLSCYFSIRFH